MSGKCQGILEFQMKFRFSNKKKKRREILKMARAVFFTVWVMLNYSDSFQILLSERKLKGLARAPDNFLKQGVADTSLGAKGVFLQYPEVFSLPNFYTRAFLEFGNLV